MTKWWREPNDVYAWGINTIRASPSERGLVRVKVSPYVNNIGISKEARESIRTLTRRREKTRRTSVKSRVKNGVESHHPLELGKRDLMAEEISSRKRFLAGFRLVADAETTRKIESAIWNSARMKRPESSCQWPRTMVEGRCRMTTPADLTEPEETK